MRAILPIMLLDRRLLLQVSEMAFPWHSQVVGFKEVVDDEMLKAFVVLSVVWVAQWFRLVPFITATTDERSSCVSMS